MNLHEHQKDFEELINVTASQLGTLGVFVEKDYWLSLVLKRLSESVYSDKIIFKGGTSLSKAFKIIDRFSEDIDLVILKNDSMSRNYIKTLISDVEKYLMKTPFKKDNEFKGTKGSKYRLSRHHYPRIIVGDFGHGLDKIILEINSFANPDPTELKVVQSYIGEYLLSQNDKVSVERFGLESITVKVLSVKRTFVEKLMSLSRLSCIDDVDRTYLKEKIRHFYDIQKIMESDHLSDFLDSDDFKNTIKKVLEDDMSNNEFKDHWPEGKLKDIKLFTNLDEILSDLKVTYNGTLQSLIINAKKDDFNNLILKFNEIKKYIPDIDLSNIS